MNKNENAILEYANSHKRFYKQEIYTHLLEETSITESSLSWYLNLLTEKKKLSRVGHGLYSIAVKQAFRPIPSKEVTAINNLLKGHFPFAHFCIYEGSIISPLQHHLSQNNIIYIETDKEAVETIFNFLKREKDNVYIEPSKEIIYHYVDMEKMSLFIKPLISESPLQTVSNIPTPTIEKILVDIQKDPDFFYLQGTESSYILENAYSLYTINENKLLRYAGRRGMRESMKLQINLLKKQ